MYWGLIHMQMNADIGCVCFHCVAPFICGIFTSSLYERGYECRLVNIVKINGYTKIHGDATRLIISVCVCDIQR